MTHLVMVTVGTRGDVLPYVAIGHSLSKAGYDVTVATHDDFAETVRAHGLGFRSIAGSFRALLETDEGREWIDSGDNFFRYAANLRRLFVPLQERWYDDCDAAVDDADAVLSHPMAWGALLGAELRRLPLVILPFLPWVPSRHLPPVAFPIPDVSGLLNFKLSELMHVMMTRVFLQSLQRRREEVGLAPIRDRSVASHYFRQRVPHLHVFSEHIQPRPRDWPEWAQVAGSCVPPPCEYEPPAELARFVAEGPPPIYIGFGSMTGRKPSELARLAIDAATRAEQRAVLVTGWSGVEVDAPAHVYLADDIPHDWLFPKCSLLVHHGGAGTLATGLRAGKPTVVAAFFGDQPYWGRRAAALGVGPKPIEKRALSTTRLASAIRATLGTARFRDNAERLAPVLRDEDGVGRALGLVERVLVGAS